MSKYRMMSKNNQYYLPKHTYIMCVHYALQYIDWTAMLAAERDTRSAVRYDKDRVQTSNDFDSTSSTAMKMVEIQAKKDMIDGIIEEICDDGVQKYLRLSVCYGFTIFQLQDRGAPFGKNYMTKLRQRFYYELSKKI